MSTRLPAPDTFDQNERNVLVFTGIAHSATHFAELLYPTLAVVISRESGIPLERVLAWSFPSYLLFGLGAVRMAFTGNFDQRA